MYRKILIAVSKLYNNLRGKSAQVVPIFRHPHEVETYLIQNGFKWEADKYGDYIKSPETFVRDKRGDCDDFAYFFYRCIPDTYEKYVIGIWRTWLDGHAICVFKDADGFYYYSSNKKIVGKFEKIQDCVYNIYKSEKVRYEFIYGNNPEDNSTT